MEVLPLRLVCADADALAMLPYVASFASNAVLTVVDTTIKTTRAIKDPVFLFRFEILQSLLVPFDISLYATLR